MKPKPEKVEVPLVVVSSALGSEVTQELSVVMLSLKVCVPSLGVILDPALLLKVQVGEVVKSVYY